MSVQSVVQLDASAAWCCSTTWATPDSASLAVAAIVAVPVTLPPAGAVTATLGGVQSDAAVTVPTGLTVRAEKLADEKPVTENASATRTTTTPASGARPRRGDGAR
ncbi:hypothetical protein GCM10008944_09720 [Cytobacillus oceanisediminis]